jgi:transglutaminase-like putative cysteine protease
MVTMDEDQAIAHVQDRLIERYPYVGPDVVRDAVQDVHNHFDGRVRNYVPILVEREAASRLAELSTRAEGEQPET